MGLINTYVALLDMAFSCNMDCMLEVKAHMDIGMYM